MRSSLTVVYASLLIASLTPARGVIFYSTADPSHNAAAPTGQLSGSGWQWQGHWGSFLGTPISPRHFIAATHVGGEVGQIFTLGGRIYTTTAKHADSSSDLVIWEVTPPFADWAPLNTNNTEVGKNLVVFGRGVLRGTPVLAGALTQQTKGWLWGNHDGVLRWGENRIEDVLDADGNPQSVVISGAVATGPLLRATFDAGAGPNECALGWGDSSGAAFIKDGESWKLAGINYAVDGPYNTSATGSGFMAVVFDEGGLYKGGENRWTLTPDLPTQQSGAFYMTRISARIDWIRSIIGDPGVPPPPPILEYSNSVDGSFIADPSATFDSVNSVFRASQSNQQRYFRIRGTVPTEIARLSREGGDLILHCQFR